MRLQPVSGQIPPFKPGQFMFLHFLDESGASLIKRPYSISSTPSAKHIEFTIEVVHGQFTGRLEKAKVGDILGVEGPLGHMVYRDEPKAGFIAGGTGISPILSMLRHIAEKKMKGQFLLFYSVKTRERILHHAELQMLQKTNPGIKVVITLTREAPDGWVGECGRLNPAMIRKHAPSAKESDWWVCGPPDMIKSVKECLIGLGTDPKKLRLEGWG
ncbi:MAG: FAD-binding oxidoreductase [Candidatus Micrarchaeota archaeon]